MGNAAERMRAKGDELIKRHKESIERRDLRAWDYRTTMNLTVQAEKNKERYLNMIATKVNAKIVNIKREMFNIGALLVEAKEYLPHGEFQKWVEENFDFSYATANNFMNVYNACLENPDIVKSIKASALYTIAAPGFPGDLREFIFAHGNYLKDLKAGEIQDICKRYKNKELTLESPEIQGLINYWEDKNQFYKYDNVLRRCFDQIERLRDDVRRLTTRAMMNMRWPQPEDGTYMGFKREYAEALEALYRQMHECIDDTGPCVYAIIEDSQHRPPLLLEAWGHPGYVDSENVQEIKGSKKWHERKIMNLRPRKKSNFSRN